jgi:pyruvate/2-oxoglutarate dehydrogenase complex dihydrolipoamide acyltransferase (E2) component
MPTDFFMPALGMNQESGKVVEWLVQEGQEVVKGQPIMVVETDKATVELEAPATGRLVNVTARDGDDVPVGKVIALILKADEAVLPTTSGPNLTWAKRLPLFLIGASRPVHWQPALLTSMELTSARCHVVVSAFRKRTY